MPDGAGVSVVVADDGPGMRPRQQEMAFRRFFSSTPGGAGLGLAIVHRLVTSNGGSAALSDTPGGGLTVTLTLLPAGPTEVGLFLTASERLLNQFPAGRHARLMRRSWGGHDLMAGHRPGPRRTLGPYGPRDEDALPATRAARPWATGARPDRTGGAAGSSG